jgi:hypothetical protein
MSSISLKADNDPNTNHEIELSPADPNGDPGAPIDDYLLPMLGIGIFLGGYLSYKKVKDQLLKGNN